jgi:hypothetical protein
VVNACLDAFTSGDLERAYSLIAADFVFEGVGDNGRVERGARRPPRVGATRVRHGGVRRVDADILTVPATSWSGYHRFCPLARALDVIDVSYFFDSQGNASTSKLVAHGDTWTGQGATTRATVEFSDSNHVQTVLHERSDDGKTYTASMKVTLNKID